MRKVNNWDDWIDYFGVWKENIGLDRKEMDKFNFEVIFGAPEEQEIEFGHYKGQNKWKTLMHIPDQRIRDSLMNLIVYQGDTEFASVEQQRNLLHNAPSDFEAKTFTDVRELNAQHHIDVDTFLPIDPGGEHFQQDVGRKRLNDI